MTLPPSTRCSFGRDLFFLNNQRAPALWKTHPGGVPGVPGAPGARVGPVAPLRRRVLSLRHRTRTPNSGLPGTMWSVVRSLCVPHHAHCGDAARTAADRRVQSVEYSGRRGIGFASQRQEPTPYGCRLNHNGTTRCRHRATQSQVSGHAALSVRGSLRSQR